jgi:lipopolysaccharide transport system permease protein
VKSVERVFSISWALGRRDIILLYKETKLGLLWIIIRPILYFSIMWFVFSKILQVQIEGYTFFESVYPILLMWLFFSATFGDGSLSYLNNSSMIGKVSFPRCSLVFSVGFRPLLEFSLGFLLYLALMIASSNRVLGLVAFIPFLICYITMVFSITFIMAGIVAKFRDVKNLLPFLIQISFYVSPVVYSVNAVPKKYLVLYLINPLAYYMDVSRNLFLGVEIDYLSHLFISIFIAGFFLILAMIFYKQTEAKLSEWL